MSFKSKAGYAYVICGILFLIISLFAGLAGGKLIAGIAVGVVLTIVGLRLISKK